jgi:glycosyltransferase involved in cell wall biosynthesis
MENSINKKIIFFIPTLSGGGAERVMSELSSNMPDSVDQTMVLFEKKITYPYKGRIAVLGDTADGSKNLILKLFDIVKRVNRFRKIVDDVKPDIVISALQANTINVLVKVLFSGKYRVILTQHSFTSKNDRVVEGLYGFFNKMSVKKLYNKADKIIAVSNEVKKDLVNNFNVMPDKIMVISNPVDIKKIISLADEEVDHFWFKEDIPIIVNMGRLSKEKNQKSLLYLLAKLRKDMRCRLLIIGDGELKDELIRLAKNLKVEDDVLFLGFVPNPFKYIAKATVFVFPSIWEGFPMAMIEAMAVGCPVAASDCMSGPREILASEEEKCGVIFPMGDDAAMEKEVRLLIAEPSLREKFSKLGRKRAEDFDVSKIVREYLTIFKDKA